MKWSRSSRPELVFNKLGTGEFDFVRGGRGAVVQALVAALVVVVAEPVADAATGLRHPRILSQVHLLVFQRAPQPLDEDIVQAAPAAIHADGHAVFGQHPP